MSPTDPNLCLLKLTAQSQRPREVALFVLRQAMFQADAAAGALFLLEGFGARRELAVSARQDLTKATADSLLEAWRTFPAPFRMSPQFSGPESRATGCPPNPAFATLVPHVRQTWLPLKDSGRLAGFIYLETPGASPQKRVERLRDLAETVVPWIYRALLRERLAEASAPLDVIGQSAAFLEVERQIRTAAAATAGAVLLTGERGSGKEAAGWALHCWSDRRKGPFVPVLASALPKSLASAELFGHERHAFTDATHQRAGRFKAADGGTVYLDEVADLGHTVQSTLLRVIEYREVARLGSDFPSRVDVRVVSSTNRDLTRLIRTGRFRADLYDRLSVFEIRLPPLRERTEDIRPLARHFLQKHCAEFDRKTGQSLAEACGSCATGRVACVEESFYEALEEYRWPGNVRELRNVILRLVAAHPMETLRRCHLEHFLREREGHPQQRIDWTLETAVRSHLERVLRIVEGNQSQAAALLGLPLSTLRSRMNKLGVDIRRFSKRRRRP